MIIIQLQLQLKLVLVFGGLLKYKEKPFLRLNYLEFGNFPLSLVHLELAHLKEVQNGGILMLLELQQDQCL